MLRVRLRVNGDSRAGTWIKVGSDTEYPNILRLREAIGVKLFPDPSYGLNNLSLLSSQLVGRKCHMSPFTLLRSRVLSAGCGSAQRGCRRGPSSAVTSCRPAVGPRRGGAEEAPLRRLRAVTCPFRSCRALRAP